MNQETHDLLFGVAVLIPFLVFVFALGLLINKFKNRRFDRAWSPLIPVIQGKITQDGGGATTSWLTGTYRGRRVQAIMTPDRNMYSGESGHRYNSFEAAVLDVKGGQGWSIECKTPILGFGPEGWQIETKDQGLAERLRAAGAIALVERLGMPTVTFNARGKTLQLSEDAGPVWVPAPARFQEELEILLQLAEINERVNPAG